MGNDFKTWWNAFTNWFWSPLPGGTWNRNDENWLNPSIPHGMTKPSKYSAMDIANELLRLSHENGDPLTSYRLTKLVYIAHGWYLSIFEKGLVPEKDVEAWKYGPIVTSVYRATKGFHPNPIPRDAFSNQAESKLDEETTCFLRDFYEKYGHLDRDKLALLTISPGTPYYHMGRKGAGQIIPNYMIMGHYMKKLRQCRREELAAA